MVSKLKTERYNGWANRDTYLYSLFVDSEDRDHAFRKVVKLCSSTNAFVDKKNGLMEIYSDLKIKDKIELNNVDYQEIINVYSKERIVTLRQSRGIK